MNQDLYGLQASGIDPEIAAQMLGLNSKKAITAALLKQSIQGIDQPQTPTRGYTRRIHPLEAVADVLATYMGKKAMEGYDQQEGDLAKQNQAKVQDALTKYEQTRSGTPAIAPATANDDEGNVNPTVPGKAGDPRSAIAQALASPLLQNNPLVKMDMAASQPRVLGRTLVDATGKTLATDSTWAQEQAAAKEAQKQARDAAIASREAEGAANREAAAERQRQAAADREALARTVASLNPKAGQPVLTKGQEAADREFGKDYAQYQAAGGSADVEKQLQQLEQVSKSLGKEGNDFTGGVRGLLPDKLRAITNPDAIAAKNKVEEVAQRNLRLVLGAQFTQVEGERLIARAYNDQMSPTENKRRVDALTKQIRVAAQTKEDAARYFEQNGTLAGWKGRMPTLSDFENAIDNAGASTGQLRRTSDAPGKVIDFNSLPK